MFGEPDDGLANIGHVMDYQMSINKNHDNNLGISKSRLNTITAKTVQALESQNPT